MNRKGIYAVVLGAGSIVLLAITPSFFHDFDRPVDETRREIFMQSVLKGERLKAAFLAKGESIVVDRIKMRHGGGPEGTTYVLLGGPEKTLVSIERGIVWKKGWGPELASHDRSCAHQLTTRQQQGLDVFVQYLAKNTEFWWRNPETYELTYLRNGREIGSEKLIDLHLLDVSDQRAAYEEAHPFCRELFSPEEWEVIVSFPQLILNLEMQADKTLNLGAVSG